MFKPIGDWLDARAGHREIVDKMLNEPIPGGSRWMFVTGSGLVFAFVLQVLTGIFLAMYFSPSATDAWASVWYIENKVTFGGIVRGLHHFGSSAMIVLCVIHMAQVFVYGAHKNPRELNWVVGVLMMFIVLGFALTGYLLPWDQKGYWATKVATGIMGTVPILGRMIQTLAQGGSDYGNLTLTRFYALHAFVLPGALIGLLTVHLYLFRRHGVTPSPRATEAQLKHVEMFWPAQLFKDTVYMMLVLAVLLCLTLFVGAPLDQPADPTASYEARPEWYFLFLFQILKYFEGPMAVIGTVVIPTAAAVFLLALPFIDRWKSNTLWARAPWMVLFFGFLAFPVALTGIAIYEDRANAQFQEALEEEEAQTEQALAMAEGGGIDDKGKIILYEGYHLFEEKGCVGCHAIEGRPQPEKKGGPNLTGYLSREWFHDFFVEPTSEKYFGGIEAGGEKKWAMPTAQKMRIKEDADIWALAEMMVNQTGLDYEPPVDPKKVERGLGVYNGAICSICHSLEREAVDGPALARYGSESWLKAFIRWPDAPHHFGARNAMPAGDNLSDDELRYLAAYLQSLRVSDQP